MTKMPSLIQKQKLTRLHQNGQAMHMIKLAKEEQKVVLFQKYRIRVYCPFTVPGQRRGVGIIMITNLVFLALGVIF